MHHTGYPEKCRTPDIKTDTLSPPLGFFFFRFNSKYLHICGCCGREVKAMDSKSIGVSPRRFESCQQRLLTFTTCADKSPPTLCYARHKGLFPGMFTCKGVEDGQVHWHISQTNNIYHKLHTNQSH